MYLFMFACVFSFVYVCTLYIYVYVHMYECKFKWTLRGITVGGSVQTATTVDLRATKAGSE